LIDFVDDSNRNAEFGEPEGEDEARRACADNQNRDFARVGHYLRADNVKVGAEATWNFNIDSPDRLTSPSCRSIVSRIFARQQVNASCVTFSIALLAVSDRSNADERRMP